MVIAETPDRGEIGGFRGRVWLADVGSCRVVAVVLVQQHFGA